MATDTKKKWKVNSKYAEQAVVVRRGPNNPQGRNLPPAGDKLRPAGYAKESGWAEESETGTKFAIIISIFATHDDFWKILNRLQHVQCLACVSPLMHEIFRPQVIFPPGDEDAIIRKRTFKADPEVRAALPFCEIYSRHLLEERAEKLQVWYDFKRNERRLVKSTPGDVPKTGGKAVHLFSPSDVLGYKVQQKGDVNQFAKELVSYRRGSKIHTKRHKSHAARASVVM